MSPVSTWPPSDADRAFSVVFCRLRQVDVKAEHFERQLHRAEQERDAMEKKYEVRFIAWILARRISPDRPPTRPFLGYSGEISAIQERVRRARAQHGRHLSSLGSMFCFPLAVLQLECCPTNS